MDLHEKLIIKVQFNDEIRKMPVHNEEITYDELLLMMERVFKHKLSTNDDIIIKYKDEDGDLISLSDDSDLAFALETCKVLKLIISVPEIDDNETKLETPIDSMDLVIIKKELQFIRDHTNKLLDRLGNNSGEPCVNTTESGRNSTVPGSDYRGVSGKEFDPLSTNNQTHVNNERAGSVNSVVSSRQEEKQNYQISNKPESHEIHRPSPVTMTTKNQPQVSSPAPIPSSMPYQPAGFQQGGQPPQMQPNMMPNQQQQGIPPTSIPQQQGMPPSGLRQQGIPPSGMPQQGIPPSGMPQQGMSPSGMQQQGMNPSGMQQQGMNPSGMPQQGMPPSGMQQQGMPPSGMSQQGMPPSNMQQQGMPPPNMQQQRMPPPNMQQQRMPPPNMQQQGMPPPNMQQQGMPPSGMQPGMTQPPNMPPMGQHQQHGLPPSTMSMSPMNQQIYASSQSGPDNSKMQQAPSQFVSPPSRFAGSPVTAPGPARPMFTNSSNIPGPGVGPQGNGPPGSSYYNPGNGSMFNPQINSSNSMYSQPNK